MSLAAMLPASVSVVEPQTRDVIVMPTHPRVAELERLGDEIAALAAHLDAATARLLDLIREFDARAGWNTGFRSCAEWLAWRVGMNLGAARERVRVARALAGLPRLAAALARGELSYAKVRALTRVATPETEERLLALGRAGTASHVERIVRGWRRVDRQAEAKEARLRHQNRALHVFHDDDGTVVLRGRLEPEVGALLVKALDAAREALYQGGFTQSFTGPRDPLGDPPTPAQQRADALALLAATALQHGVEPTAAADRYQVVVHVDAPVLADPDRPGQSVLEDGTHVSAETSARLACDASRTVMHHDDAGRIVEVAARNRTIPPALRRALQARDQGCRFPGCGSRYTEGHHIRHWARGGPTTLSNLALLCRRHHRAVHEEGFQIARGSDDTLHFHRPDGARVPEAPVPPALAADPVAALRTRHAEAGLSITARTGLPHWLGKRLDLGWALDLLRSQAEPRPPA
ncbi:MAG TPA: DUF222 domain-containing protein [Methylomirabilota bacterium]|nr:DUF222 domain-containing protein [Methylomirabilota bacterium]